jgi:ATP-dependent DNA helicase DinG
VLDAAQRIGGRTLVLTTTLKALHAISASLRTSLGLFADLDVLVQGEAPKLARSSALWPPGQSLGEELFWWLPPPSGRGWTCPATCCSWW